MMVVVRHGNSRHHGHCVDTVTQVTQWIILWPYALQLTPHLDLRIRWNLLYQWRPSFLYLFPTLTSDVTGCDKAVANPKPNLTRAMMKKCTSLVADGHGTEFAYHDPLIHQIVNLTMTLLNFRGYVCRR